MNKEEITQKEGNKDAILKYIDDVLINNRFQRMTEIEKVCSDIIEDTWEIYGPQKDAFEQYLVVVNLSQNITEKLKSFSLQQKNLYTELRKLLKGTFDKNVSLLLCIRNVRIEFSAEEGASKSQQETYEILQEKVILKIEEDPYYFKKLVLTYTDSEVDILEKKSGDLGLSGWSLLQEKISEMKEIHLDEAFEKNSHNILLRMCIKLPFISLNLEQTENMEIVLDEVKKQIVNEDEIRIWKFIDEMDMDSIKEIKGMEEKQQEALLNKWMPKKESENIEV